MKYFGTDGIRGENSFFSCEFVEKIGKAIACFLYDKPSPKIVMARDTRVSGEFIENILSDTMSSYGVNCIIEGVLPTPALCMLTKLRGGDLGIMISASHNPKEFNGIKIFDEFGAKFFESNEETIEKYIDLPQNIEKRDGSILYDSAGEKDYINFLLKIAKPSLKGKKIAIDGANGAASKVAVKLFSMLEAEVFPFFCDGDGNKINENCGATKPETLQKLVIEKGADIGFSFDGDADRLISVAKGGRIINGDHFMYMHAVDMKKRGILKNDTVVGTVMCNLGFENALKAKGIKLERTPVGDKYVYERMQNGNFNIGGEQSGHIIFSDYHTTGDGLISALLTSVLLQKQNVNDLLKDIEDYPQTLKNIKLTADEKERYKKSEKVKEIISEYSKKLSTSGRVLVRLSGTEPLLRVMVEADLKAKADSIAEELGNSILKELK